MEKKDGIKIKGHEGTFYIVKSFEWEGHTLHLVESEQYGEDAFHVCIDEDGYEVLSAVDQVDGEREVREFLDGDIIE